MNPIKLLIDIGLGALSGATGGKIDIGRVVDKAVSAAAQSPSTDLSRKDAPAVAEVVKEAIPDPKAAEGLGWQNFRVLLMVGGGMLVSRGYLKQEEMAGLVGALMIIVPWGYRNVSTWLARYKARKPAVE